MKINALDKKIVKIIKDAAIRQKLALKMPMKLLQKQDKVVKRATAGMAVYIGRIKKLQTKIKATPKTIVMPADVDPVTPVVKVDNKPDFKGLK